VVVEHKRKVVLAATGRPGTFKGKKHTEEVKRLIGEANARLKRGEGNPHFGTMWIFNTKTGESIRVKKDSVIPIGWQKGRRIKNVHQCSE
jgi:hypothetical protein